MYIYLGGCMEEGALINGTHVYVRSVFNPTEYDLTKIETKVLLAQIPTLRAIDELYLLQKGGRNNVEMWRGIERVAASSKNPRIEEFRMMYQIYGCPYDSSGNKLKTPFTLEEWKATMKSLPSSDVLIGYGEFFTNPDEQKYAKRGYNVFLNETDMPEKEFVEWVNQYFQDENEGLHEVQKSARITPLLRLDTQVVVRGKNGDYKIEQTTWTESHPDIVQKAAESLWDAGKACASEFPVYSALLKATGRGMLTNNFDLRDVLLPQNDSRLYTFGGITEEYIGSQLGWSFVKKGAYDLVIGVKNPELSRVINETKSKVPGMLKKLPLNLRNESIADVNMQAINTVFLAGDSYHFGFTLAARNWPNDQILNALYPCVIMHAKECNTRVKYLIKPVAEALLPPDKIPPDELLSKSVNYGTILHEFSHSIGKRTIYDAPLEEGKATAGALWNYPLFTEDQKSLEGFYWTVPVNLVRTIRGGSDHETWEVNEAHAIGENALLEELFASGAVKISDGFFEVDPQGMIKTAEQYFINAVQLEYGGDQGAVDEYLKPYRMAGQQVRELIQRLNELKLPRSTYVDRGTIDELETRLNTHLKSLMRKT